MIQVFHRDSEDVKKGEAEISIFMKVGPRAFDAFAKWMREVPVSIHMSDGSHHMLEMFEAKGVFVSAFSTWDQIIMLDTKEDLVMFKLTWHDYPGLDYKVVLDLT